MPPAPTPTFFATAAAWRAWLEANHLQAAELYVGFYKTMSGKPSMTWPESVDEALCFGWIDGVRKRLDIDAYMIRFTPRKPSSIWSEINVAKIEALRKAGKMRDAGEAAFAKRTVAKSGVYSFERAEAARFSKPQLQRFKRDPTAWAFFEMQAPWYQRTAAHWVTSAKQEVTRERRLQILIADSAAGRRIGPLSTRKPAREKRATRSSKPLPKPLKR